MIDFIIRLFYERFAIVRSANLTQLFLTISQKLTRKLGLRDTVPEIIDSGPMCITDSRTVFVSYFLSQSQSQSQSQCLMQCLSCCFRQKQKINIANIIMTVTMTVTVTKNKVQCPSFKSPTGLCNTDYKAAHLIKNRSVCQVM